MSSRLSSASTHPTATMTAVSAIPAAPATNDANCNGEIPPHWVRRPDGSRVWVTPPIPLVPIGPNPGKPPSPGNSNDGMPGGRFEDLDPVVIEDSRAPRRPAPPCPCLSTPSRQVTAAALAAAAPPPKALRPQAPPSQPPLKPRPPPRQQAARRLRSLAASSAKTAAAAPSSATTGTTPSPTHSSPNTCTTFTARSCAS